jgi:serine/threonine protein phosphatase PrpC
MRPIREPGDVKTTNVLYHSVFGFARVRAIEAGDLVLEWERPGENLPARIARDALARVWALCPPGGFFDRALNAPDELRERMQVDPTGTLQLLLEDLDGPQSKDDVRDWVIGRDLMPVSTWDKWWARAEELGRQDSRFKRDEAGRVALTNDSGDPRDKLDNPLVSPARRLDLAVAHRGELGEPLFRKHVLEAWRGGGTRVRDLALAALADAPAADVLAGLVGSGSDSIDAIIHALRNSGWSPAEAGADVCARLLRRAIDPVTAHGGVMPPTTLDAEGRLAAALWRWGAPGVDVALARIAGSDRGRDLIDAALASLPPRRAEVLGILVVEGAMATGDDTAVGLLTRRLAEQSEDGPLALADRLSSDHPGVSARIRVMLASAADRDEPTLESEEAPRTAEITAEVFHGPVSIGDLPPVVEGFLTLGASLARALSRHHIAGRIVTPTRDTVRVYPDGAIDIGLDADPRSSPRPPGESAGKAGDVYGAGVLLIEALVGRTWPRNLSSDRALPFLRHIAPGLPPSALAPLAAAVDPNPAGRVPDAIVWLQRWQAAIHAENARASTPVDPRGRIKAGFDTHVGRMKILHTQTNQDALFVSVKGPQSLLCVCDGISTANTGSGDLAASITTQVVASLWEQWLPRLVHDRTDEVREFLERALRMANQAVCEASLRLAGGKLDGRVPMGTTAVVAVGQGNRVTIGWLGDSRAYVVGPYGAGQLTADANQAGERMVDWHRGHAPSFDATGFALVRYVGHFDELGRAEPIPPLITSVQLMPGERLVICSDGVTDYAAGNQGEAAQVIARVAGTGDPEDGARTLIELANRGGGGDNATAIVATMVTT